MVNWEVQLLHLIISEIRKMMGVSQEELAGLLGTSFATVNRWENGHTVPNKMAQQRLYELCSICGSQNTIISLYSLGVRPIADRVSCRNSAVSSPFTTKPFVISYRARDCPSQNRYEYSLPSALFMSVPSGYAVTLQPSP